MTMRNSFPTDLAGGLPVLDTRLALATLVARDTAGRPRLGVMPDDVETPLVTGLATMGYRVRDFRAITSRTGLGIEMCVNDGALTASTTAAPPSNSRIDIIYVRPRFLASADGSAVPEVSVAQGVAALNPSRPTIPAGALVLASARVSAGATGTNDSRVVITNEAPFTTAAGGTLTVRTASELATWTPATGSRAYCLENVTEYIRREGKWMPAASEELRRGTAAERAQVTAKFGQMWQDTDGSKFLWKGATDGTWRRFSGIDSFPAASWAISAGSGTSSQYARGTTITVPTVLEDNESLHVTMYNVGTGYAVGAMSGLRRNPTNTEVDIRFMQFFNATTNGGTISWQIISI